MMALLQRTLDTELDDLSSVAGGTDSYKLSSDLHMHFKPQVCHLHTFNHVYMCAYIHMYEDIYIYRKCETF